MSLFFQKKNIYTSVLSATSLGIHAKKVPYTINVYKHNGYRIKRLEFPMPKNFPRYTLVIDPKLGWFASQMSYFVFHCTTRCDAEVLSRKLVPEKYNPSVWYSVFDKCYALAVPKNWKENTTEKLYRQGYWLDTKCNRWKKRRLKKSVEGQ